MRALPSLPPYDKSRSIIYFLSPLFLNRLNAAAVQVPIGLEGEHKGIVDLVAQKAYVFEGDRGEIIREVPIEGAMEEEVKEKRLEMIERLAEVDDQIAELFLGEEEVPIEVLMESIRRQTIALKFVPVFMGSAFKNKGVQKLLDGVLAYLPNPSEVPNYALDLTQGKPAFSPSPLPPSNCILIFFPPTHTHTRIR
jgi:elongation factor G